MSDYDVLMTQMGNLTREVTDLRAQLSAAHNALAECRDASMENWFDTPNTELAMGDPLAIPDVVRDMANKLAAANKRIEEAEKRYSDEVRAREFWRMEAFKLQHPNGALQDGPVPPADVVELQNELDELKMELDCANNRICEEVKELTRKLAWQQMFFDTALHADSAAEIYLSVAKWRDDNGRREELTKLLTEAREKAVPTIKNYVQCSKHMGLSYQIAVCYAHAAVAISVCPNCEQEYAVPSANAKEGGE